MKIVYGASVLALLAFGCQGEEKKVVEQKEEAPKESAVQGSKKARVRLSPTKDNKVYGVIVFNEGDDGVHIVGNVGGLKPGKHGFHVHEHGDCSAPDGSSAGGHFNPTGKKHGGPESAERHVGDLGNLEADDKGIAQYDRTDTVIRLSGENSIIGKSIVIHEGEDDLATDPSGNSGARISCGVIEAVE